MAIRGNNSLIVNPILVPVSVYNEAGISPLVKTSPATGIFPTMDEAWNAALSGWNAATWHYHAATELIFFNMVNTLGGYECSIGALKGKLAVDLSAYNLDNYISAHLVIKPLPYGSEYYNEQGWIENEYNFLEDIIGELGTMWVSTELYASSYTPSRPALPPLGGTQNIKGWEARGSSDIFVALIPKT